tara:strand:- start:25888 stop:27585 length:1698 start_codon:yes stop_codon:yes gene_type:complete
MGKKVRDVTDFNDLHCAAGLDAVRVQIEAAVQRLLERPAANESPDPSDFVSADLDDLPAGDVPPAPPVQDTAERSLDDLLKQFALIYPSGEVWDTHKQMKLKVSAFKRLVGKKLGQEWLDAEGKRQINDEDIQSAVRAAKKRGVPGIDRALERFVYLEPSRTVWDAELRQVIGIDDLKVMIPAAYEHWLHEPNRKVVLKQNLVFDPTQRCDPDTHINMFRGLPLEPVRDDEACRGIRALLWSLCNANDEIWTWLVRWLAFPLQNVGAKLRTAVLMHSEVQGSGKSLFFDGVMRPIYGEYSATLGQHQMESQYTDWQSNLLYGLFEEIFSRSSKYNQMGTIKQLITGETARIEKKFVSGWEEANHMNAVFLSNEIQPFPVETSDRRFLVIWPRNKIDPELKNRVSWEIKNGGPAAFWGWLLAQDLDGFDQYTEAPMTREKQRLIDFGLPSWESFYREWSAGNLDAPYHSCLSDDLYRVYVAWCREGNERVMTREKFSAALSARVRRKSSLKWYDPPGPSAMGRKERKGTFFLLHEKPHGQLQIDWLTGCVHNIRELSGLNRVEVDS